MSGSLPAINGYQLTRPFSTAGSGTSRWSFAKKDGQEWFIKEYLSPCYKQKSDGISEAIVKRQDAICNSFFYQKQGMFSAIDKSNTGNLISRSDFFRFGTKFYLVTEKVDTKQPSLSEIARMSEKQKMLLLKVLAYNISSLHKNKIVHADIKADNVLVKETREGNATVKIIDFGESFLENTPPNLEELHVDDVYMAPETFMLINEYEDEAHALYGRDVKLTRKIDIFALGVLFHQYYTGELPKFNREKYPYLYGAVIEHDDIKLSEKLPDNLRNLIKNMISADPDDRPEADSVFNVLSGRTVPISEPVRPVKTNPTKNPSILQPLINITKADAVRKYLSVDELPAELSADNLKHVVRDWLAYPTGNSILWTLQPELTINSGEKSKLALFSFTGRGQLTIRLKSHRDAEISFDPKMECSGICVLYLTVSKPCTIFACAKDDFGNIAHAVVYIR